MHELSLAGGILGIVEEARTRERFERVKRLTVEAGALAGVELRSLRFALESLAPGSCIEGAAIEIEVAPGTAWCLACCRSVAIASRTDPCPACAGHRLQPTGGTELKLRELIVQ
ncbi:MAG: hydrogenase maturation nickel metallochaperone HypA [Burkholderiales bacterium]|nr:hydrogenase maturation nickel metallochaperone HypA [Burkholderiales bacterium]MDE1929418.1 hydrogenase maturation nickel metallochaperone HypA [Burkholderiales bacterium]MDE2160646.1 hydrogenase maturation nickel metallochaperone HypA [Burkholderiales bacterium]MDE2503590.1 hydrogenase maturation nickel metallochaperone HypA [Burkholderiales bacterium]